MLMHQGIGLDAFNAAPEAHALHALFECCCSVTWATAVARARPFSSYAELMRTADAELAELSDADIDEALSGHPPICSRTHRHRSAGEQCALTASADERAHLVSMCARYQQHFGYRLLILPAGRTPAELAREVEHRLHNDPETERKVTRNELAKINHLRLERMLGPEEGYPLY